MWGSQNPWKCHTAKTACRRWRGKAWAASFVEATGKRFWMPFCGFIKPAVLAPQFHPFQAFCVSVQNIHLGANPTCRLGFTASSVSFNGELEAPHADAQSPILFFLLKLLTHILHCSENKSFDNWKASSFTNSCFRYLPTSLYRRIAQGKGVLKAALIFCECTA